MKRLTTLFQKLFTLPVLTFISGIIISVLVQSIFGGRLIPITLDFVFVLIGVLVFLSIGTLINIREDIHVKLKELRFTARSYNTMKRLGEKSLYDALIERINSAQSSLLTVSSYRPASMKSSPERTKYYEAINKLIDRHHRQGTQFTYERILQVKNINHGTIDNVQVDHTTLKHCGHILHMDSEKTSVSIQLRQVEDVLGSLSFMIIDRREIFLVIPALKRDDQRKLHALELGSGVVLIDNEGSFVADILKLYDNLRLSSDAIYKIAE